MSWWEVQDKPQPAGGVPAQVAMEAGAMESVEMCIGLLVVAEAGLRFKWSVGRTL